MITEPLDLLELMDYTVRSLEGMAGSRSVTLLTGNRTPGSIPGVSGDRRLLLQALVNLVANAIDFSPAGASVHCVVQVNGEKVTVEILDEGPGVPTEERTRIFDKYHRGDKPETGRSKGSGLGLAIVKKVVELHGGSVWMDEREDAQGSRFIVDLPVLGKEDM
jgi:signal transduction histidine kinase